ncbi:MAG: MBL fold metallo-hydrolase [Verrucomicrobiales bacterium]|nr:MBL fold metallo-hydrolase [Verrucomicrobiales bacterium]
MIAPLQKDGDLLADIASTESHPDHFDLWWLGQSGFLIKWQDHQLLFDPYLSDSLTTKYTATDKPHVRMTGRVIDPRCLTGLTATTSSHNHTDHLDAETLGALASATPGIPLVLPAANIDFARKRLGPDTAATYHPLSVGSPVDIPPFTFHAIPAAHNTITTDEDGFNLYLGFVVEFGNFRVYHSGDTLWHSGLVEALTQFPKIDVAFLPINGNEPGRKVAGNLNGTEAAALARTINAKLVIPHHFEMFEFNTAAPEEFETACTRLSQPFKTLRAGERLTV